MNKIIKRDGKVVDYNPEKIKLAIQKALKTEEQLRTQEEQDKIIKKKGKDRQR